MYALFYPIAATEGLKKLYALFNLLHTEGIKIVCII